MQKIEIDRKILQRKEINNMEKLTYTKIANITLKIDLHNGYEVVVLAEYNENAKKCTAKFYIKDKLVDDLMLMEDFDNAEFIGNEKIACSNILKFVSKSHSNNYFIFSIHHDLAYPVDLQRQLK